VRRQRTYNQGADAMRRERGRMRGLVVCHQFRWRLTSHPTRCCNAAPSVHGASSSGVWCDLQTWASPAPVPLAHPSLRPALHVN